jgi:DNA-3-methyladenine glycosylase II
MTVKPAVARESYEIPVEKPYRLDLTVSVLRRLPTNIVDVLMGDGAYVRALGGVHETVIVRVEQKRPGALAVTLESRETAPGGHAAALATVRRMLGVERKLARFYRAARDIAWLRPLVARMRGVKPPRYPDLWEACVNVIVFQQLSLVAASSISRRLILALGAPKKWGAIALYAFPTLESFQSASDRVLRAAGLSASKLSTLRRVADALRSGVLDEAALEALPSPDAAARLRRIKGIGPWTATVILLRGLGRLDVFPINDSSVARNLASVAGSVPRDIDEVLRALGPQRGMLYYHLLLNRLDARDEVGRASSVEWPNSEEANGGLRVVGL